MAAILSVHYLRHVVTTSDKLFYFVCSMPMDNLFMTAIYLRPHSFLVSEENPNVTPFRFNSILNNYDNKTNP